MTLLLIYNSKLPNWSPNYWVADRLVPNLWKLTNKSPNFTNVSQIGPFVKLPLANMMTCPLTADVALNVPRHQLTASGTNLTNVSKIRGPIYQFP